MSSTSLVRQLGQDLRERRRQLEKSADYLNKYRANKGLMAMLKHTSALTSAYEPAALHVDYAKIRQQVESALLLVKQFDNQIIQVISGRGYAKAGINLASAHVVLEELTKDLVSPPSGQRTAVSFRLRSHPLLPASRLQRQLHVPLWPHRLF